MFKFRYFVSCSGWKDGGYVNTGFSEKKADIKKTIQRMNDRHAGTNCSVKLLSITEISDTDFAEDFI